MKKTALLVIAASTLSVFAAETNLYNPGADTPEAAAKQWTSNRKYGPWGKVKAAASKDGKDCIEYTFPKGWHRIQGGGLTEVDPSAVYKVTLSLKGKEDLSFRLGIYLFDKDKKLIGVMEHASPGDPIYTLAADAQEGDKTITLTTPVSYQGYFGVAFNAKQDGSDIPNRDVAVLRYSKTKLTGDVLNLERPLKADYAKGTTVRLQQRKEFPFRQVKMTGDWKDFSFRTTGQRALTPYTKYIAIYLLTTFQEPQTILIDAPVIEKISAK